MSRSRIVGVAAASLILSFVVINATSRSFRAKTPTKLSLSANSAPIPTETATVTPSAKTPNSMVAKRTQPLKRSDTADVKKSPNGALVDHLTRELPERFVERQVGAGDSDHLSSAATPSTQFGAFAARFAAAVNSAIQNSIPSAAEANGTRKLNVSLISDEVTNSADDHAVSGVVRLSQSCDFLSNDGQMSWSREWAFEFSFVMQRDRWHCVGGKCRVVKDESPFYAVQSPSIGKAFDLPEGTWDDLDIR